MAVPFLLILLGVILYELHMLRTFLDIIIGAMLR
jgi:hypothetical protein